MTDPREAKLPKWAQEALRDARIRQQRAEEELDAFRAGTYGPEDTDTYSESYSDQAPLNLPKGGTVGFALGYGSNDVVFCRVRHGNELEIMGHTSISVQPQASNVVVVVPISGR